MQYIHKDRVEDKLPEDWHKFVAKCWDYVNKKVAEARANAIAEGLDAQSIEDKVVKKKKKAINQKASLWRLFAKHVASVNNDKCWYCESKQDRSNMPVDHFRPKARVDNDKVHFGYWWLAFDWENYRYCCTHCNSLTSKGKYTVGKGDKFPLSNPEKRWMGDGQVCEEAPILLDPFVFTDTRKLTFTEVNGSAIPNFRCFDLSTGCLNKDTDDCKEKCDRVILSIDILNLNSSKTRTSRARISRSINRIMIRIQKLLIDAENGINVDDDIELYENQLATYLDVDAPYRTAARIFFRGHRTNHNSDWFDDFTDRI